jgi:hypothetical protein
MREGLGRQDAHPTRVVVIKWLWVLLFGQNYQGFVDVSNFDGAESGEERSDLSNFIVGESNHSKTSSNVSLSVIHCCYEGK